MTKSEARNQVKQLRRELDREQIDQASLAITNALILHFDNAESRHCLLYSALPGEVDVHRLRLEMPHFAYYYPRVNGQEIEIVPYSSAQGFEKGSFNVWEPVGKCMPANFEPHLIVVPGVGFDRQGNRVGYGKGFYDRLLRRCPTAARIGVCLSFQLFDRLDDVSECDEAMDWVVTEKEECLFFRK